MGGGDVVDQQRAVVLLRTPYRASTSYNQLSSVRCCIGPVDHDQVPSRSGRVQSRVGSSKVECSRGLYRVEDFTVMTVVEPGRRRNQLLAYQIMHGPS